MANHSLSELRAFLRSTFAVTAMALALLAWLESFGSLGSYGALAALGGTLFAVFLAALLMSLVFASDRSGYDQAVHTWQSRGIQEELGGDHAPPS